MFNVVVNNVQRQNYMQDGAENLASVKPTEAQIRWQEMDYYAFIHYSVNTFNVCAPIRNFISGIEWSNGRIPSKNFNPKRQDTDEWCRIIRDAGMSGVIITAKHHDGFVLFDSRYEYNRVNRYKLKRYSIKDSPYKGGKGDLVREVMESCRKYGLKFGIYYSPWDRSHPEYGMDNPDPKIYNDYMINQVEELCSNYGEVFEMWLDTAIGEESEGKPHKYEWDRLLATIKRCQPDCMIAFGNDFRYIGNEYGGTEKYEYSVAFGTTPAVNCKGLVADNNGLPARWFPVEVNVPNRRGWYYHSNDNRKPYIYTDSKWYGWSSPVRTPELLFDIYLRSVGHNGNFLLNIPPTFNGEIDALDEAQLMSLKSKIDSIYAAPVRDGVVTVNGGAKNLESVLCGTGSAEIKAGSEIVIDIEEQKINYLVLREDYAKGQRILDFDVYIRRGGEWELWHKKTTVGKREIIPMQSVMTDGVKIILKRSIGDPIFSGIALYGEVRND